MCIRDSCHKDAASRDLVTKNLTQVEGMSLDVLRRGIDWGFETFPQYLALLRRKGVIRPWHDRGIVPGQKWDEAIDRELGMADLILLLVSMDFLNSDYIWGKELATAIARAERGDASVVPVLLRAVDIEDAPFAKLQGLPTDLRPVTSWPNRDEAWTDVAKGIRRAVEAIQQRWAWRCPRCW